MTRRRLLLLLLWLVLGQILLLVNEAGASLADKTIHIGYTSSNTEYAGAINVAIEQAQRDGLLRDFNFRYSYDRQRQPDSNAVRIRPFILLPSHDYFLHTW